LRLSISKQPAGWLLLLLLLLLLWLLLLLSLRPKCPSSKCTTSATYYISVSDCT
jgi:hypothetical protein